MAPHRKYTSSTASRTCAKELSKGLIPFGRDPFAIIGELLGRKVPNLAAPWDSVKNGSSTLRHHRDIRGNGPDITLEVASIVFEDLRISSTKAEAELGFKPIDLRTIVEGSLNWLKQKGLQLSSRGPQARDVLPTSPSLYKDRSPLWINHGRY